MNNLVHLTEPCRDCNGIGLVLFQERLGLDVVVAQGECGPCRGTGHIIARRRKTLREAIRDLMKDYKR